MLLASVLKDHLREKIREELGATYSPSASFIGRKPYPGYAHLHAHMDVDPTRAWKLSDTVSQLAGNIAKNGISTEELARARAERLAALDETLVDNSEWLGELSDSQTHPESLEDLRQRKALAAVATTKAINALAARYLTPKNLFLFVREPSPPGTPPAP